MPELPEVETIRRALAERLVGSAVADVQGNAIALRRPLRPELLRAQLVGRRFLGPERRAKFLLLPLSDGARLLVHLGMTGQLTWHLPTEPRLAHTHLVLELDDGAQLRYVDARRFGFVDWLAPGATDPSLERLGLDPLADDFPVLAAARLASVGAPIKSAIMNQALIGGVGNIYASEALWRAGIRPARPARRIARPRLLRLGGAIREVLEAAVEAGGTTLRDYVQPDGARGQYGSRLCVYDRVDLPCFTCGAAIRRVTMAGRSTFFCPACQR